MSMLPYESVPQREGELQFQSHCVLCVFWFFFFPLLELESPLWLSAQNALQAAPAHGAPSGALSLSSPATHHTAELTPLTSAWRTIIQVKRKPSEGKMRRLQRTDIQTQSMDEVQEENPPSQGKSRHPMHFSLDLFLFWRLFSPTTPRNGGRDGNCDILKQSLRPDKWAKYYREVNKRINCQWMHGTALP